MTLSEEQQRRLVQAAARFSAHAAALAGGVVEHGEANCEAFITEAEKKFAGHLGKTPDSKPYMDFLLWVAERAAEMLRKAGAT